MEEAIWDFSLGNCDELYSQSKNFIDYMTNWLILKNNYQIKQ